MSNSDRNPHNVLYEGESEKAYKVRPEGSTKSVWLPKSQCCLDDEVTPKRGSFHRIWVPDWLAEKAGLV